MQYGLGLSDHRCVSLSDSFFGYPDIRLHPVSFDFPFAFARQVWHWPYWGSHFCRRWKDNSHDEKGGGREEFCVHTVPELYSPTAQ